MSNVQLPKIYNDMVNWRSQHEENTIDSIKSLDKNSDSEASIFNKYSNKRNKIGTEFDFMEGKDSSDEEQYLEQLDKLASGDMTTYDIDGDGKVSRSEYMAVELHDVNADDSPEFRQSVATTSYLLFDVIDQAMGNSNSDEYLSQEEFQSFYRNLDSFDGKQLGNEDGVITADGAENFASYLVENIFSEDTIQKVYDLMKNM